MTGGRRTCAALVAQCLMLAACSTVAPSPLAPGPSSVGTTPPASLTLDDTEACPVTPPGAAPSDLGDTLFGSAAAFGNGRLWVGGLGDGGVIVADRQFIESDGSIGWKLGWFRIVPGSLTISGRRLDADAPPLRSSVPDGYGTQGFQASGVFFPTEGCWEVTGTVTGATLTFVTLVIAE